MRTVIKYYGKKHYPVTHFPYDFTLEYMGGPISPLELKSAVNSWMDALPAGEVTAWMASTTT